VHAPFLSAATLRINFDAAKVTHLAHSALTGYDSLGLRTHDWYKRFRAMKQFVQHLRLQFRAIYVATQASAIEMTIVELPDRLRARRVEI